MKSAPFLSALAIAIGALLSGCSQNDPLAGPADTGSAITTQAMPEDNETANTSRESRLEGPLQSTPADPRASGNAKWERRPDRTKFSAEVEDVRTSGNHDVRVNGKSVGAVRVSAGTGDLNLDSRNGHRVPAMNPGDLVEVYSPLGELILTGVVR